MTDLRERVARAICNEMEHPGHADIMWNSSHREKYEAIADAALAEIGGVREEFKLSESWTAIHRNNLERLQDHKTLRAGLGKLSPKICEDIGMSADEAKAVEALWAFCEGDDFYVVPPDAALEPAPVSVREAALKAQIHRLTAAGDNLTAWVDDRGTPDVRKWDKARDEAFRILAAIEPAPVSVREAARVLLDHIDKREDAVRAYSDDVFLSIADHGITASHIRAIAERKD